MTEKVAMKIHFDILSGLSEAQKAEMEDLKLLMVQVGNSMMEEYQKTGRVYGITEDGEEETYTVGYKDVNDFEASVFCNTLGAGPA